MTQNLIGSLIPESEPCWVLLQNSNFCAGMLILRSTYTDTLNLHHKFKHIGQNNRLKMDKIEILDLSQEEMYLVSNMRKIMTTTGLFYITGYEKFIKEDLIERLQANFREFFKLPVEEKSKIEMKHAGASWRGWFPLYGELTSGKADGKEGIYFGREEEGEYGFMRGKNQFLDNQNGREMKILLLEYLESMETLAEFILSIISQALGLDSEYFKNRVAGIKNEKPVYLFRAFNYPSRSNHKSVSEWGVAEHTDMGFLTLLKQDNSGGLEIFNEQSKNWIPAPPIDKTFVVNIGDMLEKWTHGIFIATRHRVRNTGYEEDRLSLPFFYDPSFGCLLTPIEQNLLDQDLLQKFGKESQTRVWDGTKMSDVQENMTYAEYLKMKVIKVFPELFLADCHSG